MSPPVKTYDNGKQDAWIEALRESSDRIMHRLDQQAVILNALAAKVNHIYGAAAILGAIAGLLGSVGVQVVVGLIFRNTGG